MGGVSDPALRGVLCDPGDHFNGTYEVESKYRVPDLEPVRRRLIECGAQAFMRGNIETDIYFDTPDRALEPSGKSLVLRHMLPSGRVLWICKGPGSDKCVAMELADFDKAKRIIAFLGYGEVLRIEKKRDIYFLEEAHLTLDVLPKLGRFVEIAVMTDDQDRLPQLRRAVADIAARLGLDEADRRRDSYRRMLGAD